MRRCNYPILTLCIAAAVLGISGGPAMAATESDVETARPLLNLLIADLVLDGEQISDTIYLYEANNDVMLPVGELARQLSIGITVDSASHVASGFLLKENVGFRIDPASGKVILANHEENFDPQQVRWIDGDLYVASRLLQRWWPIDFRFNLSSLSLQVLPREQLPIQLKLARTRAASGLGQRGIGYVDPGYPRIRSQHGLLSFPAIDSTIGLGLNRNGDQSTTSALYSGVFAGDLLGMEAIAHASFSKDAPSPTARITLARNDPDGGLLGPLAATNLQVGNIGLPALKNVLSGGGVGWGSMITNRLLNQPSSYGLQTLRGELPAGWDVTLFFNDALIAFAQSRGDGLYEFPDQPLVFGRNEFRLVFNGPLGQRRVENKVFVFDETVTPPGRLFYAAGAKRDNDGAIRSTVQFDAGIARGLAVTAGAVHIDRNDSTPRRTYLNGGLRVAILGALLNADHAQDINGGRLTELGIRTSIFNVAFDASRTWNSNFISDAYGASADPVTLRDRLRLTGGLAVSPGFRLPFAVDLLHEQRRTGEQIYSVQPRVSVNMFGTSFTNAMTYLVGRGPDSLAATLQANRRVAGIGVSGQIAYTLRPVGQINSFALTVDKTFGQQNRLNIGVVQTFTPGDTTITAGWTRNFGAFGLGFSGMYSGRTNMGVGLQIFTAIGRNPRNGRIMRDWQPLAGMGAVAARVFLDTNVNGVFDAGDQTIENAGFVINRSGRQNVRTDAAGEAVVPRLQPHTYIDLALDAGSLEDAQWQPAVKGVRLLARPGKVQLVDFPVVPTGEIDGTVYLVDGTFKRGIGNARLQLIDATGKVVGEAKTASDGYFVVPMVKPGLYQLRLEPEQMVGIGLQADRVADITMSPNGSFVYGVDFSLRKTPDTPGS